MFGRYDLPAYKNGLARCFNFLPLLQGPAKFRPGTFFIKRSRGNKVPFFLPFVFNDEQSYILEFTDEELCFYDSDGTFLEDAKTITDISVAAPGIVTSNSHGFSDGDEVFIEGVVGTMDVINGRFFTVDQATTNTFVLLDIFDDSVTTTGLTYTSGGTARREYCLSTVYSEDDIAFLQIAQEADVSYLVDGYHEPRKLSRLGLTNWTLSTYDRTNDPFLTASISGVTKANPGVVTTTAAHGLVAGEIVHLRDVVGMTELNGNSYQVTPILDTTFSLQDLAGDDVDTSGFSSYSSGGKIFSADDQPTAVGLYGGRLFLGGPARNPDGMYGSRGPTDVGLKRYDDFTVGSEASHGVRFFIASSDRTLERINWFAGSSQFLGIGGNADVYKATGAGGDGQAITGTSIDVKPTGSLGTARILPARLGPSIFYAQRGGKVLNSFEYDLYNDGYTSIDQSILNADITRKGIKQLVYQQGSPSFIWAIDTEGALLSLTYKAAETISAWAPHKLAGTAAKVLTICSEPLPNSQDRLWMAVERTIRGKTVRYTEQMALDDDLPDRFDFFTGDKPVDDRTWRAAMVEAQSTLVRSDSVISVYNTKSSTLTLSATSGDNVILTSAGDAFTAASVGKRVAPKNTSGLRTGMALIHTYTSATEVIAEVLEEFDAVSYPASEWYLSFDEVSGLHHLESEEVVFLGDGGEGVPDTVVEGRISLGADYFRVVAGIGYAGVIESLPIEASTVYGTSTAKTVTINELGILYRDTLSLSYGRDRYDQTALNLRTVADVAWRPPILDSGQIRRPAKSMHGRGLTYTITAESPKPCTVDGIVFYISVGEEGQ